MLIFPSLRVILQLHANIYSAHPTFPTPRSAPLRTKHSDTVVCSYKGQRRLKHFFSCHDICIYSYMVPSSLTVVGCFRSHLVFHPSSLFYERLRALCS